MVGDSPAELDVRERFLERRPEVEVSTQILVTQGRREPGCAGGSGEPGDLIVEVVLDGVVKECSRQPYVLGRGRQARRDECLVERIALSIDVEVAQRHQVVAE